MLGYWNWYIRSTSWEGAGLNDISCEHCAVSHVLILSMS